MTTDKVNAKLGWVLAYPYRYLGQTKYHPLGRILSDGSISGYIYIYPTKDCAKIAMQNLSDKTNVEVIPVGMFFR